MPPAGTKPGCKRARQYEHIKDSLKEQGRSEDTAEEIAARTVNKERARHGESRTASRVSTRDKLSSGERGGRRSGTKREKGRTKDQLYAEAQRKNVKGRWIELSLIVARFAIILIPVFLMLPLGMAFAFLGVQLAVFGVYMGASFAPNHKGMPIIAPDAKLDFFSKQVRTSRNIHGGRWVTWLMGGLNHQVEHHLFPNMSRLHLAKAREIVRDYCAVNGVAYTETSLVRSYAIVIDYLNRVGLAARDPFDCPAAAQLRRA